MGEQHLDLLPLEVRAFTQVVRYVGSPPVAGRMEAFGPARFRGRFSVFVDDLRLLAILINCTPQGSLTPQGVRNSVA